MLFRQSHVLSPTRWYSKSNSISITYFYYIQQYDKYQCSVVYLGGSSFSFLQKKVSSHFIKPHPVLLLLLFLHSAQSDTCHESFLEKRI